MSRYVCAGESSSDLGRQSSGHTGWTPSKKAVCDNSSAEIEIGPLASHADLRGCLAHLSVRDARDSPSRSEVCYEGHICCFMLWNWKYIKGAYMLFTV